jgi:hypothetical protein
VAVILNALRALRPPAPAVRLTAADTALTRRFRTEHQAIRADIDQLRTAADTLDEPGAMTRVRQVFATLTSEVWPHESAEEDELYPSLNRVLGGADPTAPMSRAHAEIAYQIARLGRLTEDIGDREPDASEIADLRGALYGLHAILRLHTVQEDETYLSLRRQRRRPVPLTARSPRTGGRDRCRQSPGQGQAFCGSRTSCASRLPGAAGRVNACRAVATSHSASVAATSTASATVLAVISAITPATSAAAPRTLAKLV